MISSLEELSLATFRLCLLDLEQIRVDEIANVALVKSRPMLIDGLLEELGHLGAILAELVADSLEPGQVTQHGDEIHRDHAAEELEALVDEAHEALESRVAVIEAHPHDDRANDVADRHTERWRDVSWLAAVYHQARYERVDFAL